MQGTRRSKKSAGYGDRTRLAGLGSQSITTMLSPRSSSDRSTFGPADGSGAAHSRHQRRGHETSGGRPSLTGSLRPRYERSGVVVQLAPSGAALCAPLSTAPERSDLALRRTFVAGFLCRLGTPRSPRRLTPSGGRETDQLCAAIPFALALVFAKRQGTTRPASRGLQATALDTSSHQPVHDDVGPTRG